jgi:3-oxoacyl-[acyl-carrier protein] reductase
VAITYAKDVSAASAVVKAIERDGGKAIAIQAKQSKVQRATGSDQHGFESLQWMAE